MTKNNNVVAVVAVTAAVGLIAVVGMPGARAQDAAAVSTPGTVSNVTVSTAGMSAYPSTMPGLAGATPTFYSPGWAGHLTQALIDLRQARGYLSFPNKFDMMDDDWSAVNHVSDAIKDAESLNIYDGHRTYFVPSESVTTTSSDRLLAAKKLVQMAKDEVSKVDSNSSTSVSSLSADIDSANNSIDKAIAADDWRESLTNNTQFLPTGSRDY